MMVRSRRIPHSTANIRLHTHPPSAGACHARHCVSSAQLTHCALSAFAVCVCPQAWNAAMMGHLPMLCYAVEKLGANPAHVNVYSMCTLMMACRFGNERCLRFLASLLDDSQVIFQSGGLGISPMSDAAKCGTRLALAYAPPPHPRLPHRRPRS